MTNKFYIIIVVLLSSMLSNAQINNTKEYKISKIVDNTVNTFLKTEGVGKFFNQKEVIADELVTINQFTKVGVLSAEQYYALKKAYYEMYSIFDFFTEEIGRDISSFNSYKQINDSLREYFNVVAYRYKVELLCADSIYNNHFKNEYDKFTPNSKNLFTMSLSKIAPAMAGAVAHVVENNELKGELLDLAVPGIKAKLHASLKFPYWDSIVTAKPSGNIPEDYNLRVINPIDFEQVNFRFVDATISFLRDDNQTMPLKRGAGKSIYPYFCNQNTYNDAYNYRFEYNIKIKGYAYIAVLEYNNTKLEWEVLKNNPLPILNDEIKLPVTEAGEYKHFRLVDNNFLFLLSNKPIDSSVINSVVTKNSQGQKIIQDVIDAFGPKVVTAPDFVMNAAALKAKSNISIRNISIDDIIVPVYFNLNGK